jgi:hypothetical protein
MSDEEKHFSALSAACVLDDHVSGRLCMLWMRSGARSERPARAAADDRERTGQTN